MFSGCLLLFGLFSHDHAFFSFGLFLNFLVLLVLLFDHIAYHCMFLREVKLLFFLFFFVVAWSSAIIVSADVISIFNQQISVFSGCPLMVPQSIIELVYINVLYCGISHKSLNDLNFLSHIFPTNDYCWWLFIPRYLVTLLLIGNGSRENKTFILH